MLRRVSPEDRWSLARGGYRAPGRRTHPHGEPEDFPGRAVAEACNIGHTPVIDPDDEALTRGRLVHVDQYYLRADTIAAANAALIEAQGWVPIVEHWGEGLLASVDGLRVAGSLVTGQVQAYDLLRVVDPVDDTYRRQMNRQLTVQESRHKLARDICHGKRGQIMQACRTGQRTSSARSAWSSTPPCCGPPAI